MTATRRDFIKTTSMTALAASAVAKSGQSANDTIRIGVVGLRGRGRNHIESFAKQDNVEVTAICDISEDVLDNTAGQLAEHLKQPTKLYTDFRKMLEDDEIDAVSIATPNHWHALQGIWACQAGKDVYVEKPCSHNLHEGKKLVEAQIKYNRIVQHGTQSRSVAAFREGMQLLHDGYLGEVYYAKGLCYKRRNTIGKKPTEPVPEGVHYDLWKGPAPDKPFSQNRFHYEWHWQWDYGNGDIGNQGVHEMDVARWGLGVEFPSLVSSIGGHFMFDDDQQTPNTMVSTFKYPEVNKMLVFEVRHWLSPNEIDVDDKNNVIGTQFLGSEGYMLTDGYGRYRTYLGNKREPGKSNQSGFTHFENFIEAVRTRKQEDLNAPIREGHISAGLCHLANTSYYMERMLRFDPVAEKVIDDSEAQDFLDGKYRTPYMVPDEI